MMIARTDQASAFKIGIEVAEGIAREFGGQTLYLPREGIEKARSVRDDEIYRQFIGGEAADDLAQAFKLSVVRIYQIIARCKREDARSEAAQEKARKKTESTQRELARQRDEKNARLNKSAAAPSNAHPWRSSNDQTYRKSVNEHKGQ